LGTLRSQGYAQALGGATSQAQIDQQQQAQKLAAANTLTSLSSAYDANQRANIATQTATGDDLRNVAQQQAQAPATSTAQIVAMLSGLPINLFTGQQNDSTQNNVSTGTNIKTSEPGWDDLAKIAAAAITA
jgi:hypothetical protein